MAGKFVEVEAPSKEEALQKGAELLGVSQEEVSAEVIVEGKKGLFGKIKPYKLKVSLKERQVADIPQGGIEEKKEEEKAAEEEKEEEATEREEITGECGTYIFTPKGLYLSVSSKEISFAQALEEIEIYDFKDLDLDAISKAVEKTGEEVLIAPPQLKSAMKKKAVRMQPPRDGRTVYKFKEDGLYLTIHSIPGKEVDLTQLLQEVTILGFVETDNEALSLALERTGEEVKISPPQPEEVKRDGEVSVRLSGDEMEAFVTISSPLGGKPIGEEEVKKALSEAGVVIEVEEGDIEEAIEGGKDYQVFLNISGDKPKPGQDARLEYLFKAEERKKTGPMELEDGKVDYRDMGVIQNVNKGTVLVQKIPAGLGTPAKTVTGKEIPSLAGKDVNLPVGRGTEASPDGLQLIANTIGLPTIVSGKVQVLPIYEVKGDVNFATGNVDFGGNVIIRGNVLSGFQVKSGGNIEINGNVEDALVEASGKITIRGGVYGKGRGQVSAGEELSVRSVERGNVKSKTNIKIGESAMHSTVLAGAKVTVSGKKGLIVGGLTRAGETVNVRTIGSRLATPTEIEVGANPEIREELKNIEKKIAADQENLKKTQNAAESLKKLQQQVGELPKAKKDLLTRLTRTQFQLMGQLKSSIERKVRLNEAMKETVAARVAASDLIYPGVKITVKDAVMLVSDELRFVTLYEKEGKVQTGSYR